VSALYGLITFSLYKCIAVCLNEYIMAKAARATTGAKPTEGKVGPFIEFVAEIKQVTTKKTASLDLEHRVVLASDDPLVNTLGLVDADSTVRVRVEVML